MDQRPHGYEIHRTVLQYTVLASGSIIMNHTHLGKVPVGMDHLTLVLMTTDQSSSEIKEIVKIDYCTSNENF